MRFTVRYWKQVQALNQRHAKVKDQAFSVTLGPLPKEIPEGALTVEAFFDLSKQPKAALRALEAGKFFSCTPPCKFDRFNVSRTTHDMGGILHTCQASGSTFAIRATKVAAKVIDISENLVETAMQCTNIDGFCIHFACCFGYSMCFL